MRKITKPPFLPVVFTLSLLFILILTACGGGALPPETIEEAAQEPAESVVEEAEEEMAEEEAAVEIIEEVEVIKEVEVEGEPVEVIVTVPVSASSSEDEDGSPHEPESIAKVEPTRVVAEVVAEAVLEDAAEVRVADGAAIEIPQASQLTAGEIDDNANWDDYLLYLRQYDGPEIVWVDVVERHIVTVTDANGRPVVGKVVEISAAGASVARMVTHSDGSILLFPGSMALPAQTTLVTATLVETGDAIQLELGGNQRDWPLSAPTAAAQSEVNLDVHFLIDTTGSMADEIDQLRDNMIVISQKIDQLPASPNVRYGLTQYRDQNEPIHVETVDFTPDVGRFVDTLNTLVADGGGDYPEDLTEGLFRSLEEPEWRTANTISLIFLIADAPPHLDYGTPQYNYAVHAQRAADSGIKIFSIASSGLDPQGEYVFRQLSQITGGRFIFLTYGSGGPGTTGDQTDMTVDPDDFTPESLDDLIVQIVAEELANLADQQSP